LFGADCLTGIAVIGYMVISPVINGFGALFFLLAALVWKYIFIWVQDEPAAKDTGGSFFPKAITHVFVGIYIQEVCLCALFFLPKGDSGLKTLPQAILMIVLIVLTVSASAAGSSVVPEADVGLVRLRSNTSC
jgi:hypothetical protein